MNRWSNFSKVALLAPFSSHNMAVEGTAWASSTRPRIPELSSVRSNSAIGSDTWQAVLCAFARARHHGR